MRQIMWEICGNIGWCCERILLSAWTTMAAAQDTMKTRLELRDPAGSGEATRRPRTRPWDASTPSAPTSGQEAATIMERIWKQARLFLLELTTTSLCTVLRFDELLWSSYHIFLMFPQRFLEVVQIFIPQEKLFWTPNWISSSNLKT